MDTTVLTREEHAVRRAALVRIAERHPGWSYAQIAAALGAILAPAISRQRVGRIIREEMLRRDPSWRKALGVYHCRRCGAAFGREHSPSGRVERRCSGCRNHRRIRETGPVAY